MKGAALGGKTGEPGLGVRESSRRLGASGRFGGGRRLQRVALARQARQLAGQRVALGLQRCGIDSPGLELGERGLAGLELGAQRLVGRGCRAQLLRQGAQLCDLVAQALELGQACRGAVGFGGGQLERGHCLIQPALDRLHPVIGIPAGTGGGGDRDQGEGGSTLLLAAFPLPQMRLELGNPVRHAILP